jgi:hypothetical protein
VLNFGAININTFGKLSYDGAIKFAAEKMTL